VPPPIPGDLEPAELRARRRALGLTQAQLGAALGLAGNTVGRWERGTARIGNPALVQLALQRLEGNGRVGEDVPEAPADGATHDTQPQGAGNRGQAVPRHNLPAERTSLIGRDQDVANIRQALLDSKGRLITLTGAGGAGKTRVALRVASGLVEHVRDGVWLVELASVVDAARVPAAVAAVLGIWERPVTPLVRTLVRSLWTSQALLVLDNCEHLADACAELVETLLHGCRALRILATSREPLRVMGEVVWRVPPLSVPDAERSQRLDDVLASPAVQLFADRARAARSDFSLTPANADTVAQICTMLAGLPLAEELAAARVRILGVQQIRERLDESLLLTDESRHGEARHKTLQATLDWSHALPSEPEQTMFRRLAVFAGGCTLEAAEAVCVGDDLRSMDVLDLLTRLVDRSLVVPDEDEGRARFRLLEPIREYAQRSLLASGEAEALAASHARYFRDLAKQLDSQRLGCHTRALDDQRQAELANFRVALGWSVMSGEAGVGLRLAAALRTFWSARGLLTEAREWFARLLSLPQGMHRTTSRARALCVAGYAAYYQGDHSTAVELLTESVATWRELGDRAGLADALDELGLVGWARADFGLARAVLGEALELARALGLRHLEGRCEYHLGLVMYEQGDFAAALEGHTHSLAVARELNDPLTEARAFTDSPSWRISERT
jgi:non-specific serine/threonine protein kinase